MELDIAKMQQMLQFWQKNQDDQPQLTLLELMQKAAEANEEFDESLAVMMDKLHDPSHLEPIENPKLLKLKSAHRLALTGTPVENRLLDLWSIRPLHSKC